MTQCGFEWYAPYLLPPGTTEVLVGGMRMQVRGDSIQVHQKCVQEQGHNGPHRSRTNVIKEKWDE